MFVCDLKKTSVLIQIGYHRDDLRLHGFCGWMDQRAKMRDGWETLRRGK